MSRPRRDRASPASSISRAIAQTPDSSSETPLAPASRAASLSHSASHTFSLKSTSFCSLAVETARAMSLSESWAERRGQALLRRTSEGDPRTRKRHLRRTSPSSERTAAVLPCPMQHLMVQEAMTCSWLCTVEGVRSACCVECCTDKTRGGHGMWASRRKNWGHKSGG